MWVLETLAVAFSMYTRIPMPMVEWRPRNMRYVFSIFPLIGVFIGVLVWLWCAVANDILHLNEVLRAAVATAIPLLVTGGIHMDGFCDTVDALSSYGSREKKLAILKDPHAGAFAVIKAALYLLLTFALWTEINGATPLLILCIGYVMSRDLAALASLTLPPARESGLGRTFADGAAKGNNIAILLILTAVCLGTALWLDLLSGLLLIAANGLLFLTCRRTVRKQFGGMTGDLAGWWLQLSELGTLAAVALAHALSGIV